MTTIVAVETSSGTRIGCDSKAVGQDQIQLEQPKVFTNNGVTYGVAGTTTLMNEIRYADMPEAPPKGEDVDRWATRKLAPALRKVAEGCLQRDGEGDFRTEVLVVVRGRVYEFNGAFGWVRSTDGVYCIGSGAPYALGALSAGADIGKALEVAAKHDPDTGYLLRVQSFGFDVERLNWRNDGSKPWEDHGRG